MANLHIRDVGEELLRAVNVRAAQEGLKQREWVIKELSKSLGVGGESSAKEESGVDLAPISATRTETMLKSWIGPDRKSPPIDASRFNEMPVEEQIQALKERNNGRVQGEVGRETGAASEAVSGVSAEPADARQGYGRDGADREVRIPAVSEVFEEPAEKPPMCPQCFGELVEWKGKLGCKECNQVYDPKDRRLRA